MAHSLVRFSRLSVALGGSAELLVFCKHLALAPGDPVRTACCPCCRNT